VPTFSENVLNLKLQLISAQSFHGHTHTHKKKNTNSGSVFKFIFQAVSRFIAVISGFAISPLAPLLLLHTPPTPRPAVSSPIAHLKLFIPYLLPINYGQHVSQIAR